VTSEELLTAAERIWKEAWENGNLNLLDQMYAETIILHQADRPATSGLAAYKQYLTLLRGAFSDVQFAFDEMVMEGDRGVGRWRMSATHTGQLPSIPVPPTGKRVTITGLTLSHMANGMVLEAWEYADMMGLMQQLGVIPQGPSK
jgi:predicted ester cyclase